MTHILLHGCLGKMGRMVSNCSESMDDISIIAGVDKYLGTMPYKVYTSLKETHENYEVILDFSSPSALSNLLEFCVKKNKPLVICTTGYNKDELNKIQEASLLIPIFKSANMSLGINIVNSILKNYTSKLYKDFDIEIVEMHHKEKLDSPSGTALMLGDTIKKSIDKSYHYVYGREGMKKREKSEIGIHSLRGGSVTGEHEIIFSGYKERISISHIAESREVFAMGALKACEFIKDKASGLYDMENLLG